MVRADSVSREDLSATVRAGSGRWSVTRVRRAVSPVDPRAESGPESRVRVALVTGRPRAPNRRSRSGTPAAFIARVDLAFPEARLAVEYEGEHHVGGVQIVRDDERRARLRAAGWRVIRLSAADLRALDAAVRRVLAALTATRAAGTAIPAARGQGSGQAPRAAPTTARASSCTCARWSGPLNDSA
ncbi:endonuclease domain-containing protein [Geodermatophilus sp. SYSU D01045]